MIQPLLLSFLQKEVRKGGEGNIESGRREGVGAREEGGTRDEGGGRGDRANDIYLRVKQRQANF